MTQPTFVPITEADQVRPARHLHVPGSWTTTRPAELTTPTARRGRRVGTPGPDAGFALRLARRSAPDLKLTEGEVEHDVLVGCALIAARRAALFGRGPSIYDVELALALWGFPGGRPGGTGGGAPAGVRLGLPRLRGPARLRPRSDSDPRGGPQAVTDSTFALTEEQRQFRETLRQFARRGSPPTRPRSTAPPSSPGSPSPPAASSSCRRWAYPRPTAGPGRTW